MSEIRKSFRLPNKWLHTKRIGTMMKNNILCCKCPLDAKYWQLNSVEQWTPTDLLNAKQLRKKKIGIVIDLTNIDRYYDGKVEFEGMDIVYKKYSLPGHGAIINVEQIKEITKSMNDYLNIFKERVCVVHCTHGYLCEYGGFTLNEAVEHYRKHRPNGIYRIEVLEQLETMLNEALTIENKQIDRSIK